MPGQERDTRNEDRAPPSPGRPVDERLLLAELKFLAHASRILSASFDYRATVARVARDAVPLLGDVCVVDLLEDGGVLRRLELASADPALQARLQHFRRAAIGADELTAVRAAIATRLPLLVSDCAHPESRLPHERLIEASGARAMMLVPLVARDTALGTLALLASAPGRYSDASLANASDLAAHVAMAIDNARLYERAREAIRARDEVLSFVSHDLRNPLMGILLTVETVMRAAPAAERRRGWNQLERIQRGAQQMRHMIDDLLDVASLDTGRLTIRTAPHDVAQLFADAQSTLAPLAVGKRIGLRFEPPAGALAVLCDRERTAQVLSNLVGNAIKFTPADGTITVTVRPTAGQVRFIVGDTGPGISAVEQAQVFDRHWQAQASARKGHGLGLYIAKRLVEAQGGAIWIDGGGTAGATFAFTLPLAPGVSAAATAAPVAAASNDAP